MFYVILVVFLGISGAIIWCEMELVKKRKYLLPRDIKIVLISAGVFIVALSLFIIKINFFEANETVELTKERKTAVRSTNSSSTVKIITNKAQSSSKGTSQKSEKKPLSDNEKRQLALKFIKTLYDKDGDVSYDKNADAFVVIPTKNSLQNMAEGIKSGLVSEETWHQLTDKMGQATDKLHEKLEMQISFAIVSPNNHERVLYFSRDGYKHYDFLTDEK